MSSRIARRHERSRDEVVAAALATMSEEGAAALSLGQVARRLGMRTPSLYVYFESKSALCDEIFARGWRHLSEALAPHHARLADAATTAAVLADVMTEAVSTMVRWAIRHRASAELMLWRPIARWSPSPQAYEPARAFLDSVGGSLATLQQRGLLRSDADLAEATDALVVLTAGVISQALSNEPTASFESGRHAARIPALVALFLHHYATPRTAS